MFPRLAISCAARTNAPSAARLSELPTLMRLTPISDNSARLELRALQTHHHIHGPVQDDTTAAMSSRVFKPGA